MVTKATVPSDPSVAPGTISHEATLGAPLACVRQSGLGPQEGSPHSAPIRPGAGSRPALPGCRPLRTLSPIALPHVRQPPSPFPSWPGRQQSGLGRLGWVPAHPPGLLCGEDPARQPQDGHEHSTAFSTWAHLGQMQAPAFPRVDPELPVPASDLLLLALSCRDSPCSCGSSGAGGRGSPPLGAFHLSVSR